MGLSDFFFLMGMTAMYLKLDKKGLIKKEKV